MTAAETDKKKTIDSKTEKGPLLKPYRIEDGRTARIIFFVCLMSFVIFTSYSWYSSWATLAKFIKYSLHLHFLVDWISRSDMAGRIVRLGGGFILLSYGTFLAYRVIFVKKKYSEFFIRMDQELHKVDWPKLKPWFRPDSEVWGATYVVILTCFLLGAYIYVIDQVLSFLARIFLFG